MPLLLLRRLQAVVCTKAAPPREQCCRWPLIVFWALYYQQNNTWVSQTTQMDMAIIFNIPDALPAFNDLLVCLFVPLLDRYIFPAIL